MRGLCFVLLAVQAAVMPAGGVQAIAQGSRLRTVAPS